VEGDLYTGTFDATRGKKSLAMDSPQIAWESETPADTQTEQTIVISSGGVFDIDAIALIGTNMRNATVEFNNTNSWSSPSATVELSADLWTELRVLSVTSNIIQVESLSGRALPEDGEAIGKWLRIQGSGLSFQIIRNFGDGWIAVTESNDLTAYIVVGTTVVIYGDRMVGLLSTRQRYLYARIRFTPPDYTFSERYRLGCFLLGKYLSFAEAPLDWVYRDNQQGLTTIARTRGGVSWAFREGPPQRVISGRMVGDVTGRLRDQIRALLGGERQGYDLRPVALVLDARRPAASTVYGRWSTGGQKENAAWWIDTDGNWRDAGDLEFELVEEP
jgi:hypothetical protein